MSINMNIVTFSAAALEQIKLSANESNSSDMGLRIAARMTPDETIDYGMGFDEAKDTDIKFEEGGITILVGPDSEELLHGAHVDFVELEPGKYHFIFLNPNDPNYKAPTEEGAVDDN
jgi:iron-sulfur cluster assembly protein